MTMMLRWDMNYTVSCWLRHPTPVAETKAVPEFCSCGARLPEDARFCHKCGKPQFAEVEPELAPVAAVVAPPPPPVVEGPLPIDFHNGKAIRAALFTASLIFFFSTVPLPFAAALLWRVLILVGGGFLSVVFYRRWTGQVMTLKSGARIGWITGIFAFVLTLLVLTFAMVAISSNGDLIAAWSEQMRQNGGNDPGVEQAVEVMKQPTSFALLILLVIAVLFGVTTILPSLGGILAAKVFEKDG
jgi:hypothetical protein